MLEKIIFIAKKVIPSKLWIRFKYFYEEWIVIKSIELALKEQGLSSIYKDIINIVPDITNHYTTFDISRVCTEIKVRGQHAFQMFLISMFLRNYCKSVLNVADIGDSSGHHIQYMKGLFPNLEIESVSINSDANSIDRIKAKGMQSICADVKNISNISLKEDLFISFETLEHLHNPCDFLIDLTSKQCETLIITVPFISNSRVGLHHVRWNVTSFNHFGVDIIVSPETTHIFELSPFDWKLIFEYTGWQIEKDTIYYQYPRKSFFSFILKKYWRIKDFEGLYGVILKRKK